MSWDVWLEAEVDGTAVTLIDSVNYTHNCNRMIREAGFAEWPKGLDGMNCLTFIQKLDAALVAMIGDRPKFRAMDPDNGWGDFDSLFRVLNEISASFSPFPSGTVRCSH